jgi:hypothetical protein
VSHRWTGVTRYRSNTGGVNDTNKVWERGFNEVWNVSEVIGMMGEMINQVLR